MTTATETKTVEDRFDTAVEAVREAGVVFALNVMTCCRSCTDYSDVGVTKPAKGEDAAPHAWTFGGQGDELVWEGGEPFFRDEEDDECRCTEDEYDYEYDDETGEETEVLMYEGEECDYCRYGSSPRRESAARRLYVYHGGGLVAAQAVRDAFEAEGFEVEWNGTTSEAVQVVF